MCKLRYLYKISSDTKLIWSIFTIVSDGLTTGTGRAGIDVLYTKCETCIVTIIKSMKVDLSQKTEYTDIKP